MAGEMGGYLELERFSGTLPHPGAIPLNCGRGCLAYLVELRGIREVWLPDFMCDSVSDLFCREGVLVHAYRVGSDLRPSYDFEVAPDTWMLLADYYGSLTFDQVERARMHAGGRLIVDETQGFFRNPWLGIDTFYSCRKWFGVADGGLLVTGDGSRLAHPIDRDESHGRMGYLLGRFERPASEFFAQAQANNDFFADEPAKEMSLLTENLLRAVDLEDVCRRRESNWACLDEGLGHLNALRLDMPVGPFMYPLMVEGAPEVRRRLIARSIYVPVLWPNVCKDACVGEDARGLASNILPLPVDQRYGEEDMAYLIGQVMMCI